METHTVSQKNIVLAAIAAVLVLAGAGAAWFFLRPHAGQGATGEPAATVALPSAGPAAPAGALPEPRIAVLDRNAILQYSKVGQDIMRQMQTFTNQARERIVAQRNALERDAKQFNDQRASLPADAQQKRGQQLQQRELELQNAATREETVLKNAIAAAQGEVAKAMEPILQKTVKDRGVNLVLDRAAVPIATGPEFDLTADVIAALDAKMTTYKVSLNPAAVAPAQ
jgi:Skp family chaperone for outer membrane proteins